MATQIDTRQREVVEPFAKVVLPNDVPVRKDGDATMRVLVGEGSSVELGTPGLRAKRGQIAVLGPGGVLAVDAAQPGTRFMLMAGKPYGEQPVYNGPYVD